MKYIIENGEQLEVSDDIALSLEEAGLIYFCDCTAGARHISPGKTWEDVNAVIEARQ